jgi:predicted Zn-dependent protease
MAAFLRSLENETRLREGASRLPSFFDSHPSAPDRVAQTSARAELLKGRWVPSPGRADLLAHTDGILLGLNPAEGVFLGDRFLHADLDIGVRFPKDWTAVNQHSSVGAIAPTRDAFVSLEHQGRGGDPRRAALAYTASNRIQLRDGDALQIAGAPAYRGTAVVQGPEGAVGLDLSWIAQDGAIFRLTGVARLDRFRSRVVAFRRTAKSFRRLTPAERARVRETRLRVVAARKGETLAELSDRTENAWSRDETAVANALFGGDELTAGQLVKVAQARSYQPRGRAGDQPGTPAPTHDAVQ